MVLLTVLAFLSIASLFLPSGQCGAAVSCYNSCAKDELSVCAHNPLKGYHTYPNRCSMDADIRCKGERWTFIHTGPCFDDECENCPKFCPAIYSPVCGYSPNTGLRTFGSKCALDRQNLCYNGDYEYITDGECEYEGPIKGCDLVCLAVYDPVCGYSKSTGFRTFSNLCYLGLQNECIYGDYEYAYDGECKYEGPVKDCPIACAEFYDPVCGHSPATGFKTFSNPCFLALQNECIYGDYDYVYDGACQYEGPVRDCSVVCPAIYSPICGYSPTRHSFKNFSSQCDLVRQNKCLYGDYKYAYDGECRNQGQVDCKKICPAVYSPVCAYSLTDDPRTFSNRCYLDLQNECCNGDYVFAYRGKCKKYDDRCNAICPRDYNPVCARSISKGYLKTFSNFCEFKATNRCKNGDFKFIRLGVCTPQIVCNNCKKN